MAWDARNQIYYFFNSSDESAALVLTAVNVATGKVVCNAPIHPYPEQDLSPMIWDPVAEELLG
jgi:hypothetical protein